MTDSCETRTQQEIYYVALRCTRLICFSHPEMKFLLSRKGTSSIISEIPFTARSNLWTTLWNLNKIISWMLTTYISTIYISLLRKDWRVRIWNRIYRMVLWWDRRGVLLKIRLLTIGFQSHYFKLFTNFYWINEFVIERGYETVFFASSISITVKTPSNNIHWQKR